MLNNLLVCIGAQKAGTSWLQSILIKDDRFSHASLKFHDVKEIHYFDHLYDNKSPHINDWRADSLIVMMQNKGLSMKPIVTDWLNGERENLLNKSYDLDNARFFAKRLLALTGDVNDKWYENLLHCDKTQKYALDITPDYSVIGKQGFLHMKKIAKNLKLIYILRDPIDRAWSGISQGKKTTSGIEADIKYGLDINNIDEIYRECTIGLDVGARTNYKKTIENICAAGLKDNLKILFYDQISEKPEEFIDSIYDFIDMDCSSIKSPVYVKELSIRVYATEEKNEIPNELEKKLIIYYKPMLEALINDYEIVLPNSWIKKYDINNNKGT